MVDRHSGQRARDAQPQKARKAETERKAATVHVTSERGESETRRRRYS